MLKDFKLGDYWHDSSLENIVIGYNDITIKIEREDKTILLKCANFIGIEYLGQWDENIIKRIYVDDNCDIIEKAKKSIAVNNNIEYLGGGVRKFHSKWICLKIELIDGVVIKIVCDDITTEMPQS